MVVVAFIIGYLSILLGRKKMLKPIFREALEVTAVAILFDEVTRI